jgi:hypothetical protein
VARNSRVKSVLPTQVSLKFTEQCQHMSSVV